MTADILQFRKRDGAPPHHRSHDVKQPTLAEIFQEVSDSIIADWHRSADKNRLNSFIQSKLPPIMRGDIGRMFANTDYVNDINVVSAIEQKLGMKAAVFLPGFSDNKFGYWAAFSLDTKEEVFTTPQDMVSEAGARALNILLYVVFTHRLKSMDRDL